MTHSSDLFVAFDGKGGGYWNVDGSLNNIPQPAGAFYDLFSASFDADTYLTIGLKAGHKQTNGAVFPPGSAELLLSLIPI